MIPFINQSTFTGRLTKEPEFKEIAEDRRVTNATIAVNNRKKVKGEWVDDAFFVNIEAWGYSADMLARVQKGRPVVVTGQLSVDKYEVDGVQRQSLRLQATAVGPLDEKAKEDTGDDPDF